MKVQLALSMTSSKAILMIVDERAETILFTREWIQAEGSELAESLDAKFLEIITELRTTTKNAELGTIFGVEGPGSFTGLRVSSAFLKGVSTALNLSLVGIASYDLFNEPFAFSLRPAKAAKLTVPESIESGFKFLQIEKDRVDVVSAPTCKKILGFKDNPYWPTAEELLGGILRSRTKTGFHLNYGYEPEFVQTPKKDA